MKRDPGGLTQPRQSLGGGQGGPVGEGGGAEQAVVDGAATEVGTAGGEWGWVRVGRGRGVGVGVCEQ